MAEEKSRDEVFGQGRKKEAWAEPEELVSLRAGGNEIDKVEVEVGAFGGLKVIDVSWELIGLREWLTN
jgi:hypothetical protein